ncbi:MAG: hypothetical protein JNM84_04260 [Planctomycetes bacterium]|nr:hypothetical protein [Planctomycetota bacterium]
MSGADRRSLWGELAAFFRTTSVDKLKSAGVGKVRVIGMDQIARLVEDAVDRVIESRRIELEEREREFIVAEAREELDRLTREVRELTHVRERTMQEAALSQRRVDELRLELQRAGQELEMAQRDVRAGAMGASPEDLNQGLQRLVSEALGEADRAKSERLSARLIAFVSGYVERQREVVREVDPAAGEQIAQLERRMAKLKSRLAQAEDELSRTLSGAQVEPGIASIYRGVQGLDQSSGQFKKKQGLMDVIFQANLKIQKGAE